MFIQRSQFPSIAGKAIVSPVRNRWSTPKMTTTTNDLYQAAITDSQVRRERWGVATHTLSNGATVFCSIHKVAGRSITRSHHRTTYALKAVGEQYSKSISRDKVAALLKDLVQQ